MRLFKSILLGLTGLLLASTAGATVTINHTTTAASTELAIGDEIKIEVRAAWNGAGALQGIFSSTGFDASVLELVSACQSGTSCTNAFRGSLFAGMDPDSNPTSLARFGQNLLQQPGDPAGLIRTVQYGSLTPIDPSGANANLLVTVLTFRAVGAGSTNVGYVLGLGDTGAQGDATAVGSSVAVTVVPEPGVAMLMGLGLAGLSLAGRRR